MKSLIVTLFSCFFIFLGVFAQNKTAKNTEAYNAAIAHIQKLKRSVILVRLHTQENKIKHYLKYGNVQVAQQVRAEQDMKNREIVFAFRQRFNFAPVYFFYSHESDLVREKNFKEMALLNTDFELVDNVTIDTSKVYLIDVGDIYFPSFGSHMKGLAVLDDAFVPLKKPFPYYVRKRSGLKILERTYDQLVLKLNDNLVDFYSNY